MILKKQKNCKMEERKIANRKIKRYIFLILIILLIKILSFINMLGKILEFFLELFWINLIILNYPTKIIFKIK